MGPDEVAELMRSLLREALILGAPVLIVACVTSFLISLVQTLTSLQDQTISTVPRLLIVVGLLMAALPWFLGRLMSYTLALFSDSVPFRTTKNPFPFNCMSVELPVASLDPCVKLVSFDATCVPIPN